jgi:hypothetical protein
MIKSNGENGNAENGTNLKFSVVGLTIRIQCDRTLTWSEKCVFRRVKREISGVTSNDAISVQEQVSEF